MERNKDGPLKFKCYPEYKDSGVEWLGEIPRHWQVTVVKRIFKVVNGATPRSGEPEYWDGEIPWVTPEDLGDLSSQVIEKPRRQITAAGFQSCGTTIVPDGSLILSTRAPIGHTAIAAVDICTNQGCRSLVFRNADDPRFFFYQIVAARPELESWGQGSTFKELAKNKLEYIPLAVPSLSEQVALSKFLDREIAKIDDLIEKKERLIELLQEKRIALITHAVTKGLDPDVPMKDSWVDWLGEIPEGCGVTHIKHLIEVRDGTHDTPELVAPDSNSFPLITSKDIKNGKILFDSVKHIGRKDYEDIIRRSNTEQGDILMPMIGTIGNPAIVSTKKRFAIKNVALFKTSGSSILRRFIYYFLLSKICSIQFELLQSGGVQGFVGLSTLRNLLILKMPTEEYTKIADYLDIETDRIDAFILKINEAIENLREYRTALISASVTGKIDIREEVA